MFKVPALYLLCVIQLSVLLLNACSSPPPALTSGSDTWLLKTVTYPSSFRTAGGETITPTDANFKFILAEFECPENKTLAALWLGDNNSAISSFTMYLPQGYSNVYVTNAKGDKHPVVLIENCTVVGLVPIDGTGFRLQFKDLEPVDLDQDS